MSDPPTSLGSSGGGNPASRKRGQGVGDDGGDAGGSRMDQTTRIGGSANYRGSLTNDSEAPVLS